MVAPHGYQSKRFEPRADPIIPALPTQVQPGLRFLLSNEARAEAQRLYDALAIDAWAVRGWLDRYVISVLPERYPHFARADEALRGLVIEALRKVAATPSMPRWWLSIVVGVRNGHPEMLQDSCESIIAWQPAASHHVGAEDEGQDSVWHEKIVIRQALGGVDGRGRWASDWDARDDEILREQEDFDFSQLKPTGEVSTDIPF